MRPLAKTLLPVIAMILALTACKDDNFGITDYSEGEPATLEMRITVPVTQKVEISRAIDPLQESRISQLILIGFEKNSNNKIMFDLSNKLKQLGNPTDLAGVSYNLTETLTTRSGIYRMYIIANYGSPFSGHNFTDLSTMAEADLRNVLFENGAGNFELSGSNGFPMSQYIEEFRINPGKNTLDGVVLKRAVANVQFNFGNGKGFQTGGTATAPVYNKPNFVPKTYSVYNVPVQAPMFPTLNPMIGTAHVTQLTDHTITDGKSFSFFMLEDMQTGLQKNDVTVWKQREEWNHNAETGSNMQGRMFTNAPTTAAFVVVEGDYTGPVSKDKPADVYTGTVRFIIHLGDFSTTSGNLNNYNVVRNTYQVYNVTVESAYSIMANVTVDIPAEEKNPAIEGNLYNSHNLNVDAHYTKAMIRIPVAHFNPDEVAGHKVIIASPKTGFARQEYSMDDLKASATSRAGDEPDYKWIQFQKPVDANTFPEYAGIDETTGECLKAGGREWGYITDLSANPDNYCVKSADGLYYYTAAFIDENVYTDLSVKQSEWADNPVKDRLMIFNAKDRVPSADGQNVLAQTTGFYITQSQLISSYDLTIVPKGNNPFGFEETEEPTACATEHGVSATYFPSGLEWDSDKEDLSHYVYTDVNGQYTTTQYYPSSAANQGGFYKVNDDGSYYYSHEGAHKISQALAARNRDLDGNGIIEGNEIRWYIPTTSQYLIMWFARNNIPDAFKLYDKTLADKVSGTAEIPHYFTSSPRPQRRVYMHDLSAFIPHIELSGSKMVMPYNNIRFCRNIGITADQTAGTSEITNEISRLSVHDATARTIRLRNAYAARPYTWTQPYPIHDQFMEANEAPLVMEYSDPLQITNVPANWDKVSRQNTIDVLTDRALAAYNNAHGTAHTSLPDGWRIPNSRELLLLFINGVLENVPASAMGMIVPSCTFPYGQMFSYSYTPLYLQYEGYGWKGYYMPPLANENPATGYVILVRDKTE